MKVLIHCPLCVSEASKGSFKLYREVVRDSSVYPITCDLGHETIAVITNPKHETLFEIGLTAIHDGYYREAVSSFQASLERWWEFYIRVVTAKHRITQEVLIPAFKEISRQSERQYGAFVFLRALEANTVLRRPTNNMVKFRNNVIHKGEIPTREKAEKFGREIWECISEDHDALKNQIRDDSTDPVSFVLNQIKMLTLKDVDLQNAHGMRNIGTFCMKRNEITRTFEEGLRLANFGR